MMLETKVGVSVNKELLHNYFKNLVNLFFKILPIREKEEPSLVTYMTSLQVELLGCKEFVDGLNNDSHYLSLLAILQYLIDNPDSDVYKFKREVFKAISICNKLKSKYASREVI